MMGRQAGAIFTLHQHREDLPWKSSVLERPIPVNGLHRLVKNHRILGQGSQYAVGKSLVTTEEEQKLACDEPGPGRVTLAEISHPRCPHPQWEATFKSQKEAGQSLEVGNPLKHRTINIHLLAKEGHKTRTHEC